VPFSTLHSSEGHVRQSLLGFFDDEVGLSGCQNADPINDQHSLTIQHGLR
jgi:hypothetical protein